MTDSIRMTKQVPREEVYVVWRRGDGYIDATAGGMPARRAGASSPLDMFELLLESADWNACAMRIRAERTAAVMNEDIWPIAATAPNRHGVMLQ